jgi:HD-like signal output (HDOD) protein
VILGGSKEESVILDAIQKNIARTCILMPWEQKLLIFCNKTFQAEKRLKDLKLFSYFENLNELPTINTSYQKILQLIDDDKEIEDIANAIERDPSMTAKLLRVVNSAYYGVKTTSIKHTVTYLGMRNIRDLVMSTAIFDMFNNNDVPERIFQPLWQQSFLCSKLVNMSYKILGQRIPAHASLAGLLVNIGMVFLLKQFGSRYTNMIQEIKQLNNEVRKISLENLEIEAFGFTHSEVGGYLLNWWEIPYSIVEATLFQHNPFSEEIIDKELLCILHLAEHYSSKTIFMDSNINYVEECFKFLGISKDIFEEKVYELLA